jgi:molybdopterin converting factor small subunit
MSEIDVRLLGVIKDAAGTDNTSISIPESSSVNVALRILINLYGDPFKNALLDPVTQTPISTLILLNGVEIGNLQGLETKLNNGDQLVILSVTHGG